MYDIIIYICLYKNVLNFEKKQNKKQNSASVKEIIYKYVERTVSWLVRWAIMNKK
jgi:hypothetical protein